MIPPERIVSLKLLSTLQKYCLEKYVFQHARANRLLLIDVKTTEENQILNLSPYLGSST